MTKPYTSPVAARFCKTYWVTVGLAVLLTFSPTLIAQDKAVNPDGAQTIVEALEQLAELKAIQAPRDSSQQQEFQATQTKRLQIAESLARIAPDEATRRTAVEHQFESLRIMVQQNVDGSLDQLWSTASAFASDKDSEVASLAGKYIRTVRLQRLLDGDRQQAQGLHDSVLIWLKTDPVAFADVEFALEAATGLEKAERYQLAASLYDQIDQQAAKLESSSKTENLLERVSQSKGRLALIGQRLDVQGATIKGVLLKPEALNGKVVLLDFWASWCAPCRKEMPLIRKMHDRYHEHGFVVVGICMDEEEQDAKDFLADSSDVNWPILFERDPERRSFNHPLAKTASVAQLPTAFLLDRQGRVISATARGENLERWLTVLFDETKSRRSPVQPGGLMMTKGKKPEVLLKHR